MNYHSKKRKRNGIKTQPFNIRIDEDILTWAKDIHFNISAFVNEKLRLCMEWEQERQQKLKL